MYLFSRWLRISLAALALLLGWAVLPTSMVATAQAQAVFEGGGLVELIPADEIVGDGQTAVKFSLLALEADGSPIEGLTAKLSPTGGTATVLRELGGGVYEFDFTPPAVDAVRTIEITIKGKKRDKTPVARVYALNVQPPPSRRLAITANPPELVLGQDASSTINIQVTGAAGELALELRPTAGEVANLTPLGNGRYSALFTPPKVNYPQVSIITVADRNDPGRSYGTIAIPLVGKTSYPITSTPGANVMLRVGERDFGPIQADATGRANVPIVVPPGVQQATLTTAAGAETKTETIDLKVPESKRIALFPAYAGLPGDRGVTVPVRVAVTTAKGEPASAAQVNISASSGTITAAVHEGNGIYKADYTPAATLAVGQVSLAASLAAQPGVQTDTITMPVVPVRPGGVTLSAEPGLLPQGATGFKALVQVVSPEGKGMSGQQVLMVANGAELRESVKDLKGGDYQALFDLTGAGPVELSATVQSTPTGNPLRNLVILSTVDRLPNDGLSSAMLTVVAADEFGYPVAGVPVTLEIISGDGSLPSTVTTNDAGIGQVYYTAGRGAGLVSIRATASGRQASAAVLQAPASVAAALELPRSGSQASLALRDAWASIVQVQRIEREGQAAVVPVVAPPAASVGELASLKLSAQPSAAAAGGTVTLHVKASDAQGQGVSGLGYDFIVSAGTLGALTDKGDGTYTASLTVPAGLTGEVMVSAADKGGKASSFLKIPITAAPASIWGAEPTPEPTPEPAPVAQPEPTPEPTPEPVPAVEPVVAEPAPVPEPPKEPKAPSAHRWLRGWAALGTAGYRYNYDVNATPRSIVADGNPVPYGESLQLSGDTAAQDGTGDAVPLSVPTVDVHVMGWLPQFEYVGADVRYRTTWFGVETDSFTQPHEGVDMSWVDHFVTATIQARYFHDVDDNRYWIGAQGGIVSTALPLVAMWTPEGQARGLWFFPWGFTSMYGGVRGGAELGFGLDVLVSGSWGTEAYSGVFASDYDLALAYEVVDHVTVNFGYNRLSRHIVVPECSENCADGYGSMVEASDLRSGVYLGVGTAF
jgi:hypothetical protein